MESLQSLRRMTRLDLYFKLIIPAPLLTLDWVGGRMGQQKYKARKVYSYYILYYHKFNYYKFILLML